MKQVKRKFANQNRIKQIFKELKEEHDANFGVVSKCEDNRSIVNKDITEYVIV